MTTRKQYTFKRWCFTYHLQGFTAQALIALKNAIPPDDKEALEKANIKAFAHFEEVFVTSKFASFVFQVEACPVTDRLHLQGYASFKTSITRTAVKKILGWESVHLEPAHSDAKTNFAYCTKEETRFLGPWAYGDFSGSGHRSDLDALYAMAEQYATGHEMLREFGGAGMRHLYLYQRTVRVLLDDDESDRRIADLRRTQVAQAVRARDVHHHGLRDEASSNDDDDE